ncbi:MAG: mandelate racemase/muconate lactonizing enzyme family protein [Sedimentisphaerales bacterium]|nr:mandelate racemase/muconate lactonizing enzyme family protein [Sedimentisphaerales bacterium]
MKTDARVVATELYFLPVQTRVPLKFGPEILTSVTCARVKITVEGTDGKRAVGWGETPLSVQWVWPSSLPYQVRYDALQDFTQILAGEWASFEGLGHPIEVGYAFIERELGRLLEEWNEQNERSEPMPWLAALVCCSAFDIALHDAYGQLHGIDVYQTYTADYMKQDLSAYLTPADDAQVRFVGKYPEDFLEKNPPARLPAWHLVGGKDPLDASEKTGDEPKDEYPVLLADWIRRDGLTCLKVKLRGNDPAWDYDRLVKVGQIGMDNGVFWLTTDFNCTVTDPVYVNSILDRLKIEHPRIYQMILYVEQPFPYDLETHRIDVHSVSARKPLFMDESAHDWKLIRVGRTLGWTGVALKTCKTQTGALLSLCWAKAHGMTLMVQDLTNPMLAQIPHVRLAAHAGTIMGVETNAMQFYPAASAAEEKTHPGLYRRRNGQVDLSTLGGPGFGYYLEKISRTLPAPAAVYE